MEPVDASFRKLFAEVTGRAGLLKQLVEAKSYIAGEWQSGCEREICNSAFEVYEPATGKVYGLVRDCSLEQIKRACLAAAAAQKVWCSDVGEQEKKKVFRRFINLLETYRVPLVAVRVKESGRTIEMCDADVQELIDTFDHYYDEIPKAGSGNFEYCQMPDKYGITSRSPYGRGLIICPWNFLAIWGWGVAAELAGGNAAIVKISRETPFAAAAVTELLCRALRVVGRERWQKLKSLVQLIQGRGKTTGELLVEKGDYEHLTFTGGVETGRKVAAIAGRRLKKTTMELGGHNAIAVMPDYPLEKAVDEVLVANLGDAGERCVSARAAFVEVSIFEDFVEEYIKAAKKLRIGHPADLRTQLNPLISRQQWEVVQEFVSEAYRQKIHPQLGGYPLATDKDLERARREGFNVSLDFALGGYYYVPTVFINVPLSSRLMREECFGPVLCVNKFSGRTAVEQLDNAVKLINFSDYGLSNAVLTYDLVLAMRALRSLETGLAYIGRGTTGAELNKYFGGVKDSGWGRKGRGIEDSTYIKQVYIDFYPQARMAQVDSRKQLKLRYSGMPDFFSGKDEC